MTWCAAPGWHANAQPRGLEALMRCNLDLVGWRGRHNGDFVPAGAALNAVGGW